MASQAREAQRPSSSPRSDGSPLSPGMLREDRARQDDEAFRRMAQRFSLLGVIVWPSFALLDAFMAFVRHPGAPFGRFVAYRVVVELLFVAFFLLARRPAAPIGALRAIYAASYTLTAVFIALMALDLGGLTSAYVHGASIVILVLVATDPRRWIDSIRRAVVVALAFPAVMGVASAWSPEVRAQWASAPVLAEFASHYVFLLATAVIGSAASHAFWAAQEQVFRARRLGRYRLQAPIGRGGMGEVWLAWDAMLKRNVALKILRSGGEPAPSRLRRFEREAQAASLLRSPHTIKVYDFGASDDGLHYIAMEYLPGADLAALVARLGPLPPARARRIAVQACEALVEAHEAGVIHRDIKPHNVFVTHVGDDHDFVKVLDFGIARITGPEEDRLTQGGGVVGTPLYMAPELWLGGEADARSDVYALGATLVFALTGEVAYVSRTSDAPTSPAMPGRSGSAAATDRALPPELDAILGRCLSASPDDRFASVRELQAALTACTDLGEWTPDDAAASWAELGPHGGWRAGPA